MVGVTRRVKLNWRVDSAEYDRFREWVDAEYGAQKGRLGQSVDAAMREWLDEDGYDRVEELVDRLVRAAGRRPSDATPKNKNIGEAGEGGPGTTRVGARVSEDLKTRFAHHARTETEKAPGELLTDALRSYRGGGRAARLESKLDRVVDDAESVLAEVRAEAPVNADADGDADADAGLSKREERIIAICERLRGTQFTEDDLRREIDDIAARGERASEPTVQTYREAVLNRLEYEPHPENPELWLPAGEVRDLVGADIPAEIRRPVEQLDREERHRRIKLALGERAAAGRHPKARAGSGVIRAAVLDEVVSVSATTRLLEEVAFDRGFEVRSEVGTQLQVDLEAVAEADPDLVEDVRAYRRSDADAMLSAATTTSLADYHAGRAGDDVAPEMARIESATPAADGGPNGGESDE